jgi:hypothetical protein
MQPPRCPSMPVRWLLGLVVWAWCAAAGAQPVYTPITLDDPTPQADAVFGGAVAGVGDVNGDTVPDLLVGAQGQDVGGNLNQGQVSFSGTASVYLGDGAPVLSGAAFSVTTTPHGLQLSLGLTALPGVRLTAGGVTID